jgi:hypothetical protein
VVVVVVEVYHNSLENPDTTLLSLLIPHVLGRCPGKLQVQNVRRMLMNGMMKKKKQQQHHGNEGNNNMKFMTHLHLDQTKKHPGNKGTNNTPCLIHLHPYSIRT